MGVHIPRDHGLAALRFSCVGAPDTMVSTFGYSNGITVDTPFTAAQHANDIATALTDTAAKLLNAANFPVEYTFLGVTVMENQQEVMVSGVSNIAPVAGGLTSTPTLPPNCAFLVRKNSGAVGRRGRGRMYFPPIFQGEGFVGANGQITGNVTATQTRLSLFLTNLQALSLPMVLLHGITPGSDQTVEDLPVPSPVTSLTIQMLIASQRRRLR